MSLTTLEKQNEFKIKPLEGKAQYGLWQYRVKLFLLKSKLWDTQNNTPKEDEEASYVIASSLSDPLLQLALSSLQEVNAPNLWDFFHSLYVTSDLSSKSTAFAALCNFTFDSPTMTENKSKILTYIRDLSTAFQSSDSKGPATTINISDLAVLFCLINLPPQYHALRSTLEETTKGALSIDSLFDSLIREETSQAAASAKVNRVSSKPNPKSFQRSLCQHKRNAQTCWTCNPSLRPFCHPCKNNGMKKYYHTTGSSICTQQQKTKDDIKFNIDSGSTDHIAQSTKGLTGHSTI